MEKMFCFQCEQTAGGKGCTINGVCGKKGGTANLQDELTGVLIGLSRATIGNKNRPTNETDKIMIEGLFTTITNVSFDDEAIKRQIEKTEIEKSKLVPRCLDCSTTCNRNDNYDMKDLWNDNEDIRSLKSLILFGLRGMAAYAYHAMVLGYTDKDVNEFFYEGLIAVGGDLSIDELLGLVMKTGEINLKCMELLDRANTETYGTPEPTQVSMKIEKGPFIVVTGHDLYDLHKLLEQTKDKGINIYTHGELLPAHAYPKLKEYKHLKGNFGTAWQNQQKEFDNIPAPILFTTNCLMPVKDSYRDRVFTTEVVAYPGMVHIDEDKDFSSVIEKALELGGYKEDVHMTGINGGDTLTTGFARGTVSSVQDKVVDAVKSGAIRHFLLVGGCDGAKPGRNYYTEFVKQAPKDTVILTLACGKYRFNDLDLGDIGGLPRLMDMGQCNDAYSAIKVAVSLANAFECGVNDLPLSMVLSWYEQKAVCILLTLLHLGIKNIYIGPSLPAFLSKNVLDILVDKFALTPISTPEEDMKKILG
ncbi:hydroxylamine reductase [Clostridioides difficile]|uniref:Hydroxylamine reductase n=1 Tax=Clostridioides difficile TaxID=1496 RepID=A0A9P3TW40_CLODI|nr:hydroxylamine reductase [Clostridioides difficile]AWH77877.1 hydroxylamine reductase [Clostridioides difficile]AWH81618.1 hydroxylamine reductase [Clostridioides difficile]AXU46770.1 hydroxylamine reductase [Clostridioides difficile]AXU50430.1 hydroxylamine reductase [Clostridioides difficile]AXU64901.1 hydroxylamine reductase [Clostridioides difficile]